MQSLMSLRRLPQKPWNRQKSEALVLAIDAGLSPQLVQRPSWYVTTITPVLQSGGWGEEGGILQAAEQRCLWWPWTQLLPAYICATEVDDFSDGTPWQWVCVHAYWKGQDPVHYITH